jgi:tetratricopeptide (TPR) repeat protein
VVAFFLFARYRIQVVAALLPLAALGVTEVAARARQREWRRLAPAAALLVAGWLFSFQTIGIFSRHEPIVQEMRLRHLALAYSIAGRNDEAIATYKEAVSQCAVGCPASLGELAELYRKAARASEGVEYFRGFTRERPERADAWRYLATLLEADGREDEARRVAERAAELR